MLFLCRHTVEQSRVSCSGSGKPDIDLHVNPPPPFYFRFVFFCFSPRVVYIRLYIYIYILLFSPACGICCCCCCFKLTDSSHPQGNKLWCRRTYVTYVVMFLSFKFSALYLLSKKWCAAANDLLIQIRTFSFELVKILRDFLGFPFRPDFRVSLPLRPSFCDSLLLQTEAK